ncbi:MAG TPA: YkgJ family cysteine cluster protein [Candidatus Thermoplasmatota archaeon]|nr:YkgJ family cysteine cluster protein [Candidatus Thermoplasmatota archaeon]
MTTDICAKHGCAVCCYETEMPLTVDDISRLVALGHAKDDFVTWSDDETAQLKVREEPGKPCFFLRENRCSVYADRPQGCRIYPLVMNERGRVVRDEDCPHRAEFPMDASAGRRIQRVLSNLSRRP